MGTHVWAKQRVRSWILLHVVFAREIYFEFCDAVLILGK